MDFYYDDQEYDDLQNDYDGDYLDDVVLERALPTKENLHQVLQTCILPSLYQIKTYILITVGWSLIYRFFCWYHSYLRLRKEWILHCSSVLCGLACIYFIYSWKAFIIVFLSFVAYVLLFLLQCYKIKNVGVVTAICMIASHFFYEILWNSPNTWQLLRGTQMVMTMKVISLAFDLNSEENTKKSSRLPGLMTFLGYLYCPPTIILGPWISFSVYMKSQASSIKRQWKWIIWCFSNILAAIIFLSLSNCIAMLLFSEFSLKWLQILRDAFAIRCSHYFICFLAQGAMAAGNINLSKEETPNKVFGFMITKPWHVELPDSLSSAIRNWNIPMHKWLKVYIFQTFLKKSKMYFLAIISTYLISSLLHGMDFRIYLVLLSLAGFAYVENMIREKLAEIFNICITSTQCKKPCRFEICKNRELTIGSYLIVISVNSLFSAMAAIHLAYVGVLLSSSETDDADLSISSGLEKWSELNYLSHIVNLSLYFFNLVI